MVKVLLILILGTTLLGQPLVAKDRSGTIYKISNSNNDLVYVGLTIRPIKQRFREHLYNSKKESTKFYQAIQEIGAKNFKIEALEKNIGYTDLIDREKFFIEKYNSFENGYNSTRGGEGAHYDGNGNKSNGSMMSIEAFSYFLNMRRIKNLEDFHKFRGGGSPANVPGVPELYYGDTIENIITIDPSPLDRPVNVYNFKKNYKMGESYKVGEMVSFEEFAKFLLELTIYTNEDMRSYWARNWKKIPVNIPAHHFYYENVKKLLYVDNADPWMAVIDKMQELSERDAREVGNSCKSLVKSRNL